MIQRDPRLHYGVVSIRYKILVSQKLILNLFLALGCHMRGQGGGMECEGVGEEGTFMATFLCLTYVWTVSPPVSHLTDVNSADVIIMRLIYDVIADVGESMLRVLFALTYGEFMMGSSINNL